VCMWGGGGGGGEHREGGGGDQIPCDLGLGGEEDTQNVRANLFLPQLLDTGRGGLHGRGMGDALQPHVPHADAEVVAPGRQRH